MGEPHDRCPAHARPRKRLELLRGRHEQRRRFVGPDDARGMRVERHDDGSGAALAGDAADAVEDLAMAAVHAVEISERQDRLGPTSRPRILGEVDNVHHAR